MWNLKPLGGNEVHSVSAGIVQTALPALFHFFVMRDPQYPHGQSQLGILVTSAPESGLPRTAATPAPLMVENGKKCRYPTGPGKISLLWWGLGKGLAHSIGHRTSVILDRILRAPSWTSGREFSGSIYLEGEGSEGLVLWDCLKDLKQFRLKKPEAAGELFSNIERLLRRSEMSSALCVGWI